MEKEKLSEQFWGMVGENSFSPETKASMVDDIYEDLPKDESNINDYISRKVKHTKTLMGQYNHDVGTTVNAQVQGKIEEFKKNYKPETPPTQQQSSNPTPNDEIAKKLKELEDFKISLEKRYQDEAKVAQRNSLIADAKKKATDQGAVDETILSFVLPLINPTDNDTADTLSATIKAKYDEAYTKLKGGGYNPAAGNSSISVNPVLSSDAKKLREKAAEERKKMKV